MVIKHNSKSLLQRRKSVVTLVQPLLDGLIIVGVAYFFAKLYVGYLNQDYIILMLILLGIIAVVYDRHAIYRSSTNFSSKVIKLFNAWSISFLIMFLLGFLNSIVCPVLLKVQSGKASYNAVSVTRLSPPDNHAPK